MTSIYDYNNFEPVTPERKQYIKFSTGEIISRRQYDNLVSSGAIPSHPNGALNQWKHVQYFNYSLTKHEVISAKSQDVSSLWRMATSNSPPVLPNRTSVAFRLLGDIGLSTGSQTVRKPIGLQTNYWSTRAEAWEEFKSLMQKVRSTSYYQAGVFYDVNQMEVIFRTSY